MAIYESLGLINEQLWLGHFEMWSGSGLVVFRHSTILDTREDEGLSLEQAEAIAEAAVEECERFYPVFQFVLWGGKSPGEAISAALSIRTEKLSNGAPATSAPNLVCRLRQHGQRNPERLARGDDRPVAGYRHSAQWKAVRRRPHRRPAGRGGASAEAGRAGLQAAAAGRDRAAAAPALSAQDGGRVDARRGRRRDPAPALSRVPAISFA